MSPSFQGVTEAPGLGATREQLRMLSTRYHFAAQGIKGARVLEVACGTGIGLGYLLEQGAASVLGYDIDENNIKTAKQTYKDEPAISLQVGDVQDMSTLGQQFDLIICFEAIYYFQDVPMFLEQCRSLLSVGGRLVICSVNAKWPGFYPSPFSSAYWSPKSLEQALEALPFSASLYYSFPIKQSGVTDSLRALIRAVAVSLHLFPKTLAAKALLKRIFYGKTLPLPARLSANSAAQTELLEPLEPQQPDHSYKVYYVEAIRE